MFTLDLALNFNYGLERFFLTRPNCQFNYKFVTNRQSHSGKVFSNILTQTLLNQTEPLLSLPDYQYQSPRKTELSQTHNTRQPLCTEDTHKNFFARNTSQVLGQGVANQTKATA